ncbi:MAG TPA: ROK family protein [Candidatus Dormibacteraeota bacterium]|nr:ROK family protein [Candidatus Dormibacteraeota bacterium]
MPASRSSKAPLITLSIDVGGTGIKGDTLDSAGKTTSERVRVPTPYPLSPSGLVVVFQEIAAKLPTFDRISVGFPGVVRAGVILSAPHFVREKGDETPLDPALVKQWDHFNLAAVTAEKLGRPTRVGNDAEVQGMAVIEGKGLEVVLTLGTGVGSAIFEDGRLGTHLELAHHPLHKGKTYNEYLGDQTRKRIGGKRWNKRVAATVEVVRALLFFDHLYVGGGNSANVKGDLGPGVSLVDNDAGILGGIRLWAQPARAPRRAPLD